MIPVDPDVMIELERLAASSGEIVIVATVAPEVARALRRADRTEVLFPVVLESARDGAALESAMDRFGSSCAVVLRVGGDGWHVERVVGCDTAAAADPTATVPRSHPRGAVRRASWSYGAELVVPFAGNVVGGWAFPVGVDVDRRRSVTGFGVSWSAARCATRRPCTVYTVHPRADFHHEVASLANGEGEPIEYSAGVARIDLTIGSRAGTHPRADGGVRPYSGAHAGVGIASTTFGSAGIVLMTEAGVSAPRRRDDLDIHVGVRGRVGIAAVSGHYDVRCEQGVPVCPQPWEYGIGSPELALVAGLRW